VSGTTEGLSRKISTAQDLAAVVRSMKALAASSIGQYERAVAALHDYSRTVELGLSACLRAGATPGARAATAFTDAPSSVGKAVGTPARKIGAIVFGSDQGLVGRFNEVLMEFAMTEMEGPPKKPALVWAVGERMHALIPATLIAVPQAWPVPSSVEAITSLVGRILIEIAAARERGDIAELHVFHNRPKSAAAYEPVGIQLLPLDAAWRSGLATLHWPTRNQPQVIDPEPAALEAFIRGYLFVVLFQACAESLAAENASRLAAMQRAEKNIREIIADLNRKYRRLRQESIDDELFEVIAGYESLSHGSAAEAGP
jgi:F-type H+-transporting ATPase subunit gamma